MALTEKLGIIVDTWALTREGSDFTRIRESTNELFKEIRASPDFPKSEGTRLLDVGSGDCGSDFANRYGEEFPDIEVIYLDNHAPFIAKLNKPNKICANATAIPLPNEYFNVAYTSGIMERGILKRDIVPSIQSYRIVREIYRVLKEGGLFIFTQTGEGEVETKRNLAEIGFGKLRHLLREKWYGGIPTDTYLARK